MLEHLNPRPTKPNRVVVIGGAGFVGSAIVRRLQSAGIAALVLTRRDVDLLAADAAPRLAARLAAGDSVVAVAAEAPVRNLEMLSRNIAMLRAMVDAFSQVPPHHLVNIGSDAVFGDEPLPLTESAPKAPSSLHGVMHLAREIAFAEVGAPLATLRPTLIYGADDPHNGYGPNRFRRLAEASQEITLFGEGEERRDHVFVGDVAELAVRIVLHRSRGSLNAATGQVWSFRQIAEMIARLYQPAVAIRGTPRKGAMPHGGHRPFDPRATGAAFPDFKYTPLPEGLGRMCRELQGRA